MSQPYVGEIRIFAGNFAPNGWAFCNGQILPISEYETLFNLIGTTYGGDGQLTFGVPDLRGRLPVHQGTGPGLSTYVIGSQAGVEQVTLTTNQLPAHSHGAGAKSTAGNAASPQNGVPAVNTTALPYGSTPPITSMNSGVISAVGGSQPHENMQPYQCVTFIISLFGIFPTPA